MTVKTCVTAKFKVGDLYIARRAADELHPDDVFEAFVRHMDGDWGNVDKHDWNANEEALQSGLRLLSSYVDRNDIKFWIITEADRSATTILLPDEY